jgi:hypothetical protein
MKFKTLRKISWQERKRQWLVNNGLAPSGDKTSLRKAANEAFLTNPIRRIESNDTTKRKFPMVGNVRPPIDVSPMGLMESME